MNGPLDASVTLDAVFAVVGAKRVPLAPELAGYLALEIAEGAQAAQAAAGDIDPRAVYIGEEGSVALVRPRRERPSGDTETSVRAILSKLLEVGGAQTPALTAAARRAAGGGLPQLVVELEAALIPVNRAAGRRALARLAREVKRVLLGVGRNASRGSSPSFAPSSRQPSSPERDSASFAPSSLPPGSSPDEAPTAKREALDELSSHASARPDPQNTRRGRRSSSPSRSSFPPSSAQPALSTVALRRDGVPKAGRLAAPPADDVDGLLASFGVTGGGTEEASRELKALIGLDATAPPARVAPVAQASPAQAPSAPAQDEVEALLARTEPLVLPPSNPPKVAAVVAPVSIPTPTTPLSSPRSEPTRSGAVNGSSGNGGSTASNPSDRLVTSPVRLGSRAEAFEAPRAPRETRVVSAAALVVLVAGALAVWALKPSFFTGHGARDAARASDAPSVSASSLPASTEGPGPSAPPRCLGSLLVSNVPTGAEVLLREGMAPIDVERMPAGARLEFVATADGYSPRRSVVPAGAPWDPGPDGKPRFELAVQLDKSRGREGAAWPPGDPGSDVGGKGQPGNVHVVTTPRGADVWLLAGGAPEARIDAIPCGEGADLLVAGPGSLRRRLRVSARDFKPDNVGVLTATISAAGPAPAR